MFGLKPGEAIPTQLLGKTLKQGNIFVHSSFKPAIHQPPFTPMEVSATPKLHLLVSVSGEYIAENVEAARAFLLQTMSDLTDKYQCRFENAREWIGKIADVHAFDVEAHVSYGNEYITLFQRDGRRVVQEVRIIRFAPLIKSDPPEGY